MVAYTYPLLGIFWTMLWFFAFVVWIWLLVAVLSDVFRSRDMGGLAKAAWTLFVIVVPFLGVLVYLIARGGKMHERAEERSRQRQEEFDASVRQAAQSTPNGSARGSSADELTRLATLRDNGTITEGEFQAEKAKVLAA